MAFIDFCLILNLPIGGLGAITRGITRDMCPVSLLMIGINYDKKKNMSFFEKIYPLNFNEKDFLPKTKFIFKRIQTHRIEIRKFKLLYLPF